MSGTRVWWTATLSTVLGLFSGCASSQKVAWHPAAKPPPSVMASVAATLAPPPASNPAPVAPFLGVTLGKPVALAEPAPAVAAGPPVEATPLPVATLQTPTASPAGLAPVSFSEPRALEPTPEAPVVTRSQAPPDPPAPLSGPPPVPPPSGGAPFGGDPYNPSVVIDRPLNKTFLDRCRDWFGSNDPSSTCNRAPFQSDHAFDNFISPMTTPSLFEDARALTELRPVFIYQSAPHRNEAFGSGNAEFFGVQGRLAFTERWSLVLNQFGFLSLNPHGDDPRLHDHTSFAPVSIGPKYTFLRSTATRSVGAVGLNFEIPSSSSRSFQNTDTLGLDPYLSFAQNFGRLPNGYGSFNFLNTTGYSFGVNNRRSDFFHSSFHLDYDVGDLHKIYPLLELNWFHYTTGGRNNDFNFEGTDLVNFGARHASGLNVVTLAFGGRYKFSECLQTGVSFEFPLTNTHRTIEDFRLGLDVIFRY
jgi:hypothetical protein